MSFIYLQAKQTRRTIIRLVNLSSILALRRVSCGVARRFSTYDHLVEANLMTVAEKEKMEKLHEITENRHQITWYPILWAQHILANARKHDLIKIDLLFSKIHDNLNDIASLNGQLIVYSWVNIPLVYTQLVTIAVHLYFFVALFGRQFLNPSMYLPVDGEYVKVDGNTPGAVNLCGYDNRKDFYFPFFTSVQFIFYFGWLKVAEILINPFGDDDDDFDLNYIVDRNFQIGYIIVDGMDADHFETLEEDAFEGELPPASLPHTAASYEQTDDTPIFITDDIIKEVEEALDQEEPLFVSDSRRNSKVPSISELRLASVNESDSNSPSLSGLLGRRPSVKSFGSNLYDNIKWNFSNIGGELAPMAVIDEGENNDPENPPTKENVKEFKKSE